MELDSAVDYFLEIAFDSAAWTPVLERFTQAVGAYGTVLLPSMRSIRGPFPHTPSLDDACAAYVREGWIEHDLRDAGLAMARVRGAVTDTDFLSPTTIARSPYFNDFIRKQGLGPFAGIALWVTGELTIASIQRPLGAEPFARDELHRLSAVAPRISTHLSILTQLDAARTSGLVDALSSLSTPAFLLDRRGRVLRMNGPADALVGHDIQLVEGRLAVSGPDDRMLQSLLAAVLRDAEFASPWSGRPWPLRRRTGCPLLVRALRLRGDAALACFANAWALVTVTDPDRRLDLAPGLLRDVFALTAKEAEIAVRLLARDGDTRRVATETAITYQTLRTHLKHIHAKLGTADLPALIGFLSRFREAGAVDPGAHS